LGSRPPGGERRRKSEPKADKNQNPMREPGHCSTDLYDDETGGPGRAGRRCVVILQIGCFGSLGNAVFSMKIRALPRQRNFD
jgi:hypothetical protein